MILKDIKVGDLVYIITSGNTYLINSVLSNEDFTAIPLVIKDNLTAVTFLDSKTIERKHKIFQNISKLEKLIYNIPKVLQKPTDK